MHPCSIAYSGGAAPHRRFRPHAALAPVAGCLSCSNTGQRSVEAGRAPDGGQGPAVLMIPCHCRIGTLVRVLHGLRGL